MVVAPPNSAKTLDFGQNPVFCNSIDNDSYFHGQVAEN
jgi:hypothetical protein